MKKGLVITLICLLMLSNIVFITQVAAGPSDKTTVVIGFKDHIDKNLVTALGGNVNREYSTIQAISVSLPQQAIDALAKNPNIAYIDNEMQFTATDAELTNSWGVDHIGAGVVQASVPPITGSGINVAVIDTGINYKHTDLIGRYKGGFNFVANTNDPFDDNGHGSHCAGIIAATDDGNAVVGVAPQANIYAVKVLDSSGSGSLTNIVAGIDWAIKTRSDGIEGNDIQVISMSLGASRGTSSLQAICDAAYNAGIVVVAAAGNNGFPAISYPANYASVIAVGATDSSDRRASFSNYGSKLELVAPGVNIISDFLNQDTMYMSGTSMACPHVAGGAALILASPIDPAFDTIKNGVWDASEVRNKLDLSAKDLGATGRDTSYGYGLVDAVKATTITPPEAVKTMHVESITMKTVTNSQNTYATAQITILDSNNNPVNGATVTAQWSGATSDRDTATTSSGSVTVQSSNVRRAPTGTEFKVTVTSVQLAGYTFVPGADSNFVLK